MAAEIVIKSSRVLVVEGKDEVNFFSELFRTESLTDVQIIDAGGKSNIRGGLKAIARAPNFKDLVLFLGVIRDADDDFNAAFTAVQDALRAASLAVPDQPSIPAAGPPRVNIFILPSENGTGALEDLCIASANQDAALPCVNDYVHCLTDKNIAFSGAVGKVKTQVLLASRVNSRGTPVRNIGEAALSGQWPWAHAAFSDLKRYATATFR